MSDHRENEIFLTIVLFATYLPFVWAGLCWEQIGKANYCKGVILRTNVSKEECCKYGLVSASWSENQPNHDLFYHRAIGNRILCSRCVETCSNVVCGQGKKCIMKNGKPKCVCKCKRAINFVKHSNKNRRNVPPKNHNKGSVCGTDLRTYRSWCHMKKKACRTENQSLKVNYFGNCTISCDNVKCQKGKYCVQDVNLNPHCIECSNKRCGNKPEMPVCGENGVTYRSTCNLEQASCLNGVTIRVAYKGRCIPDASCRNILCSNEEKCLIDESTGLPRCVLCSECSGEETFRPVCGSNDQTYDSACDMINDSCRLGYIIKLKSIGVCDLRNSVKIYTDALLRKHWL